MTEFGHCILCPTPLSADTKPEHLWLQSAGGKKTSRRLYCDVCNNEQGSGPDKALAESTEFIRSLMGFRSGKGQELAILKGFRSGEDKIAFKPGGIPVLDGGKPFVITSRPDGAAAVEIRARNAEHLRQILPHVASAMRVDEGKVREMLLSAGARRVSARIEPQRHQILFGGPLAMRSMMRTCISLWAERHGPAELSKPGYEKARRFVKSGDIELVPELTQLDSFRLSETQEIEETFGPFFNLAFVASDGDGRVAGYFRLYNACAWRFVLCERGGPPHSFAGLVFDPANPKGWKEIRDSSLVTYEAITKPLGDFDARDVRDKLVEMLEANYKASSDREINRIIEAAWSKLQLSPGSLLTRELLDRFSGEVAHRFTLWMLKLPFEEEVSVSDLADGI